MPFKYAVLWELTDPAQPVGIVVEQDGFVLVELPRGYGMPKRYQHEYRVLQPDMHTVSYRPGQPGYMEQVLIDLQRHFAVMEQGVVEDADYATVLGLLEEHVLAPRTQRRANDYPAGLLGQRLPQPAVLGRAGQAPAYTTCSHAERPAGVDPAVSVA